MKKLLLSASALLLLVSWARAAAPSIITGTWNRAQDKEVKLYRIVSGRLETMASYQMMPDAKFGFAFEPAAAGFYVLGNGIDGSQQNKYVFYFKPGDRLTVAVNDSTYTLAPGNTPENTALTKWHDKVYKLERKSVYFNLKYGRDNGKASTYADFFPELEKIAAEAKTYRPKTPNAGFDKMFADFREYDLLRYAYMILFTPRSAHPQTSDYPDFYRNIDVAKLTATASLLDYPFGSNMPRNIVVMKRRAEGDPAWADNSLDQMLARVGNDALKGELVVSAASAQKTYDGYMDFASRYGRYIVTGDQKERMEALRFKMAEVRPKTQTIDFSGTDAEGRTVALSDLKGKVVVVDVWATWCGPCKGEIPHLKKLEEQYHGKDVVFLSISIDEAKDRQKWADFVKNEGLAGLQLFAGNGWQSDVVKLYGIKGIPRFMLVDKAGNMVTDDSPRPSSPELKTLIDKCLAQ